MSRCCVTALDQYCFNTGLRLFLAATHFTLANRFHPILKHALGWNAEYNYTPHDVDGADVSALELKLPLTFEFSKMWSVFTSYNPRWNFANQDTLRQRLELGLTRVLGSHDQFALSVGVELPLARAKDSISWKTTLGVTWLFN